MQSFQFHPAVARWFEQTFGSPTEPQMRNIERTSGCSDNGDLRNTLVDVYQQAKKNKVSFADLIDQKIKTAQGLAEPASKKSKRR